MTVTGSLKYLGKAMLIVGVGALGLKAAKVVAKKAAAMAGVSIPMLK